MYWCRLVSTTHEQLTVLIYSSQFDLSLNHQHLFISEMVRYYTCTTILPGYTTFRRRRSYMRGLKPAAMIGNAIFFRSSQNTLR